MLRILVLLFLFCTLHSTAQNLVPNSDFENFSACPSAAAQLTNCLFWSAPNLATPDYLNICGTSIYSSIPSSYWGYQYPHSGDGYVGIITYFNGSNFREFLQIGLISPLDSGICYEFEVYVSAGEGSKFCTYDLGAYFSDTLIWGINNSSPIPFTPQIENYNVNSFDTINWTLFSGNYTALGGEEYLIIGNYKTDINTAIVNLNNGGRNDAYYFIDDVSVTACNLTVQFTGTNNLCPGSCAAFQNLCYNATSYQWFFQGAITDTSTDINPSNICYLNPGSYDVQLIATNANGSDTLLITDFVTVFPSPPPQSISQSGDTLFAIAGSNAYQWYYNGNLITGATDYFFVASTSGDYNVVATDTNGCEVEAVINDVLALTPLAVGFLPLAIYPNPATEWLTVNSYSLSGTAITISIYDMLGELAVLPIAIATQISNVRSEIKVDVSALESGLYYIEISEGKKTFRSKFLKR